VEGGVEQQQQQQQQRQQQQERLDLQLEESHPSLMLLL
jgi:hypothetical protein